MNTCLRTEEFSLNDADLRIFFWDSNKTSLQQCR